MVSPRAKRATTEHLIATMGVWGGLRAEWWA